jgi:hypothetical protein
MRKRGTLWGGEFEQKVGKVWHDGLSLATEERAGQATAKNAITKTRKYERPKK